MTRIQERREGRKGEVDYSYEKIFHKREQRNGEVEEEDAEVKRGFHEEERKYSVFAY